MRKLNVVMSGLALASLVLGGGFPGQAIAQSSPQRSYDNLVNKDNLLVTMEESADRALLGGKSVFRGKVKNQGNAPLYNVGWTAELPQGVNFKGVKAGPGDFGSPKVTILIWNDGRTTTLVHWNNVADLSPGAEAWFEIEVDNNAPKKGTQPPKEGKYFVPGESFEAKVWASGSQNELVLPAFGEYGVAGGPIEQENQGSRVWASDRQKVQVEGVIATMAMSDIVNGVALRGNKESQRQVTTIGLDKTEFGDITLNQPVKVSIDPAWEVMGVCVKSVNCFIPSEDQLRWVNTPTPHWELSIPPDKFDFGSGHHAEVSFELAALDKKNTDPRNGIKVNPAGLGGDGDDQGTPNDEARFGAGAEAYKNNTGESTQDIATIFSGLGYSRYVHPWSAIDQKYKNQDRVEVKLPPVMARIEDATIEITTEMDDKGNYKNNGPATKVVTVKTNEYTRLPENRAIVVTLPPQECFVNKPSLECITSGSLTFTRKTGDGQPVSVTGTVATDGKGVSTLTIPASNVPDSTSSVHVFSLGSKVLGEDSGKEVVNGKPLKTTADFIWKHPTRDKSTVDSNGELPATLIDILSTVAFPLNGQCPTPLSTIPEGKKIDEDPIKSQRSASDLGGVADTWGKLRKVSTGDELCFQVNLAFPQGITTKDPELRLYLPSQSDLVGDVNVTGPGGMSYDGTLVPRKQLVLEPANKDAATKLVKKPEERKPIKYTFGQKVEGGSTLSVVYKVAIKNGPSLDPLAPPVLWDNLAKLSYRDHEGEYFNARDTSSYDFISPSLMLSVDKPTANIKRGDTTKLTYTVRNVGGGAALAGSKIAVRLPESVTCNDVVVSGNAAKENCIDTGAGGRSDKLLSGHYLIVTLNNPLAPSDPNGTTDETQFSLDITTSNDHAPKTAYKVEAGILSFAKQGVQGANNVVFFPKNNAFCKNYGAGLDADTLAIKDGECALAIANDLFKAGGPEITSDKIGKEFIIVGDTAQGGALKARTESVLTSANAAFGMFRSSSDANQDPGNTSSTNRDSWIVPGERGGIRIQISPPTSAKPAVTAAPVLVGSTPTGHTKLELTITGMNMANSGDQNARFIASDTEIKQAIKTAFGSNVDETAITVTPRVANNAYFVEIPLKGLPSTQTTIALPNLFTVSDPALANNQQVGVTASLKYKPVTLIHPDEAGTNRLNAAPIPGVSEDVTNARAAFTNKTPVLTATKSVLNRPDKRISGGQDIEYEVVLHNTGEVPVYDVKITDTLPNNFSHKQNLNVAEVTAGITGIQTGDSPWNLTSGTKVGEWGTNVMIPANGRITLRYQATSPQVVTVDEAYRNTVVVPFSSQPGTGKGVVTKSLNAHADVRGSAISAITTILPMTPRHPNNAVQHGETVKTQTRIRIPAGTRVPNLSLLTELTGATINRDQAQVTVTCPPAITGCQANPSILAGDSDKVGVVISNTEFVNNTNAEVSVTIDITNLVVTDGSGPVTANGNAYRGTTVPGSVAEFNPNDRASSGSSGSVPVLTPSLNVEAALISGHTGGTTGEVVAQPIEPGTDGIHVRIELTNQTENSVLRNVNVDVRNKLESIGLVPKPGFADALWDNGSIKTDAIQGGENNKKTLYIPVEWKKDSFQTDNVNPRTVEFEATGETGPINANIGAAPPETAGKRITDNAELQYTPLLPQPSIGVSVTTETGDPINNQPPVLHTRDKVKVTFTPQVGGANGYNPLMCVKAEVPGNAGAPLTIKALELYQPAQGVTIISDPTACGQGEIVIQLPNTPGTPLPPVSFLVETLGTPIDQISTNAITARLIVDSKIEGKDAPGPRRFQSTPATQNVQVSPGVDLKVIPEWIDEGGKKIEGNVAFDDFVTETKPVRARITVSNIGEDPAKAADSTVKVKIPTGFTIDGTPSGAGWTCQVSQDTGHDLLTCTRVDNLPGNEGDPLEVIVKSPHGPGVRLTTNPLVIQGGHNDDRGAASPFDHNPTNDRVNTQATVRIPTPDLAPVVTMNDTILRSTSLTKPFTVTVTNNDDGVRANEARLQISTNAGGGTLEITKPNGWNCSALVGTYVCVYPNATTGSGQVLPTIEGTVTVPTEQTNSTVQVGTQWQRPGPGGIPTTPADKNPANDNSFVHLVPFNNWVDGKVTVEFKTPNPNQDQEAEPIIRIIHNDGGGSIPPGSKVKVKVPEGATVGNSNDVNNCIKTEPGNESTPATWTCDITRVPTLGGNPLEGPTVTGFTGPNQKIVVTLEYPDPQPTDPDLNNNTGTGTTAPSAPVPGPQPPKPAPKPTPIPDPSDPNAPEPDPSDIPAPKPEDRPTTIPQPPTPPASPAPANPGRTPALKEPEERANGWIESVYPAEGRAPIVLIGRDNVFADSLSSGGLQGILDAPLLLNPVSHLSDKTKATLDRLQPEQVIILGGPVAQSPAVEAELKQLGWNVSRVHGPTRVETAIDAATVHAPDATHGILARAYASDWGSGTQAFADALSGGALAARQQRPVFLTPTGELTDTLRTYLAKAKITHLTVVGSTEAVSSEVEAELHKMGITTNRISGANRAETAINVAQSLGYWHAGEAEAVLVVNGESEDAWTDAFPAALYAKRFELPVVLSGSNKLLPETFKWLAPGVHRTPPTRVICGYSVGPVKQCAFSPAKAPDQQPTARPTAPPTP